MYVSCNAGRDLLSIIDNQLLAENAGAVPKELRLNRSECSSLWAHYSSTINLIELELNIPRESVYDVLLKVAGHGPDGTLQLFPKKEDQLPDLNTTIMRNIELIRSFYAFNGFHDAENEELAHFVDKNPYILVADEKLCSIIIRNENLIKTRLDWHGSRHAVKGDLYYEILLRPTEVLEMVLDEFLEVMGSLEVESPSAKLAKNPELLCRTEPGQLRQRAQFLQDSGLLNEEIRSGFEYSTRVLTMPAATLDKAMAWLAEFGLDGRCRADVALNCPFFLLLSVQSGFWCASSLEMLTQAADIKLPTKYTGNYSTRAASTSQSQVRYFRTRGFQRYKCQ